MNRVAADDLKERLLPVGDSSGSDGHNLERLHARRHVPVLKHRAATVIVTAFTSGLAYCGSNSILYLFLVRSYAAPSILFF
jgi:hypothetical protein